MYASRMIVRACFALAAVLLGACAAETLAEWRSVPIMPGANVLETGSDSLVYEISSPLPEIERFYVGRLEEAGWTYLGLGEGVGGLFLILQRAGEHLEISAYSSVDVDHTRVVISLR